MSEDKVSAIKKDIVDITQQHWEQTGRALLLSTLGHTLAQRGYDLRSDLGHRKLEPFIQIELSDKVTAVVSPYDPLVRGVVPTGKKADPKELYSKPDEIKQRVNFDRRLWTAFSRPVAPNHQRLVCFDPEISVEDLPADLPKSEGMHLVPEALTIQPGTMAVHLRNEQLQKNILKWLEDIHVDVEKARARPFPAASSIGKSALDVLIKALEAKDLERISIPLDIVAKLLRKRPGSQ